MKRRALIKTLVLSAIFVVCISCDKNEQEIVGIKGISLKNYPRVDGSTSANILNTMVFCKLLGVDYSLILLSHTGLFHRMKKPMPMLAELNSRK